MSAPGQLPATGAPTARGLLRSVAIAAAVASAILITIVLPAEYGVDPTRIGRLLGLTAMGETKMTLAREAGREAGAAQAAPARAAAGSNTQDVSSTPPTAAATTPKSDVTEIRLSPGEGKEVKLAMRKDAAVAYSWNTIGGVVNYDTHADSPAIKYHGYGKGTGTPADSGRLIAAFDGMHGWFWRNRTGKEVVVVLRTSGDYQELKRMQ